MLGGVSQTRAPTDEEKAYLNELSEQIRSHEFSVNFDSLGK